MTVAAKTDFRRVEHHMGTAVTLAGRHIDDELADGFFQRVRDLEAVLSRFQPDSDISRLADGRAGLDDVDWAVREVLSRCVDLRHRTDGWFDHEPHRSQLDPNALAKGWIVEQAALELRLSGVPEFFVNAGGDVLVHRPHPSNPYRVGVQHPLEPEAVVAVLEVTDGAVATSGTYERGEHIRGAENGRLLSVTVAGPELGECDALATAVFAAGRSVPDWWGRFNTRHSLLTVTADGHVHWRAPEAGTSADRTCRLAGRTVDPFGEVGVGLLD